MAGTQAADRPAEKRERTDRNVAGALSIVGAVFLMSFQDALVKYASADLNLWQIYVLRAVIATPILLALGVWGGRWPALRLHAFSRWAILRAFLLVAMYIAMYAGVPVLGLPTIAAAFYTGPLFITLLSALLLGERVGPLRWLAIAIGFAGVVVILRPGGDSFDPFVALPVLAGLFYALAAIITRGKCRAETSLTLALTLNLALLATGAAASLAILALDPTPAQVDVFPFLLGPWSAMASADWALMGLLAVLIIGIGVGLAAAYQLAPSALVATFDYSYLIFAAVWSYVFFADIPDTQTVLGMALIAGAGLLTIRR